MAVKIFAAIDVGSTQLEMKIYEISKRFGFRELDHVRYIIELGSDTYSKGMVSFELVQELCTVLAGFKMKMEEYLVDDYTAIGGSALREADNCEMILDQIWIKTGLSVKMLSNEEQRFLILKSVAYKMQNFEDLIAEGAAIVDLGAGSLQVSVFEKGKLSLSHNIWLGSLRIRELLSGMEGQTSSFVQVMEDYIGNDIESFRRLFLKNCKIRHIIAVGEEFATIINYINMAKNKDFLTSEQFNKIYNKIKHSTPQEIAAKYGIPYELATVIIPSGIIYKMVMDSSTVERLWEPEADICDGMAVDYSEREERFVLSHDFQTDILSMVRNLCLKFDYNAAHINNVLLLSLQMFDGMKKISGLNNRDRLLLQLAAMLHDCGKFISMTNSIQTSAQMIRMLEVVGLSVREKEMVASIVLYNSGSELPRYQDLKNKMSREEFIETLKMAAILRMANSMDGSHRQKIDNIRITINDDELRITADSIYDLTLEQGTVEARGKVFEEIFGLRPVLRQKRNQ